MNWNATINGPICVPNPKGIPSHSPGLRGTSYPGCIVREVSNPNGVVSFGSRRCAATPLGLKHQSNRVPRVVASLQPWALLRSPFGANRGTPNPNGIPSQSPGLRGTNYPGCIVREVSNPDGVVSFGSRRCAATPLGLKHHSNRVPRVVASLQPWALLRSPFGANRSTANPNGIPSHSPGLRGTSYPGCIVREVSNPNGVVSFGSRRCAATPLGLKRQSNRVPRVVASLQPWAEGHSPFGANSALFPTQDNS